MRCLVPQSEEIYDARGYKNYKEGGEETPRRAAESCRADAEERGPDDEERGVASRVSTDLCSDLGKPAPFLGSDRQPLDAAACGKHGGRQGDQRQTNQDAEPVLVAHERFDPRSAHGG